MFNSTFPISIHLGNMMLPLHGIFEAIGVFVAFRYYLFLKSRQGDTINSNTRIYIIVAATLGAVLGARIIGALENYPEWFASPQPLLYFSNNKTLVGGLVGGLFTVEVVKKIAGEKKNTGDLFTYPLILGMMIGRIGCFSAGVYEETYGVPTTLPWGIDLGDGLLRHPVTLYEIVFLLCLWFMLKTLQKKLQLQDGALFKLFLISYLIFRFLLDFIKPGYRYLFGLGTIQLTCIATLLYYIRYFVHPHLLLKSKYAG